eukprot:PLAT7572.3.p1 GENE.PLAT7572.3~~PLAT7572.3.p1  ORF type:complete len:282 (+),score=75.91 PLAT7572.3:161-1006(+)
MALRKAHTYTPEALELIQKMLLFNPDFYSMWNYRKEALLSAWEAIEDEAKLAEEEEHELWLTAECLRHGNPKSYGTWYHRKWVVARGHQSWDKEMELCGRMLELDERNFHCWNYRRWILSQASVSPAVDFAFTTERVLKNFSNYSAWHQRTTVLPRLEGDLLPRIVEELDTIQQAVFTEPDDQAPWMYQEWLLAQVAAIDREQWKVLLKESSDCCEELLEVEEESKWALLRLATLLRQLVEAGQDDADHSARTRSIAVYHQLQELDSAHRGYHAFCLSRLA